MYKIFKRYQFRNSNGIQWTDWFCCYRNESKEDVDKALNQFQKLKEPNKLKSEYKILS